jgi:hypothetical protein
MRGKATTHAASIGITAHRGTESGREWGRKAILVGWIVTMLGIAGYVTVMIRAGEQSGILEALFTQGPLGWASAAAMVTGIGVWLAGHVAFLREIVELPSADDGGEL